jgi:hypothetical protein
VEARPVSTIPSTDAAFKRAVEKVWAEAPNGSPRDLEARLRPLFPRVAVFERLVSGEHGHLYAYRDGGYQQPIEDRWWEAPGAACVCIDASTGELTHVSAEWADLMAGDPQGLVGRHYMDFLLPEARPVAVGMFEALLGGEEIDSEALVVRADGTPLTIEFHAHRTNGEIDVRYRRKT